MPTIRIQTADNMILQLNSSEDRLLIDCFSEAGYTVDNDSPHYLKDITSQALGLVIRWLQAHPTDYNDTAEYVRQPHHQLVKGRYKHRPKYVFIPKWDQELLDVDNGTLCGIIQAAHLLKLAKLVEFSTRMMANRIRGKTAEQIRELFQLTNDLDEGGEDDDDDDIQFIWMDRSRTADYVYEC